MKTSITLKAIRKVLIGVLITLVPNLSLGGGPNSSLEVGPGGTGGGHPMEGVFVFQAKHIATKLKQTSNFEKYSLLFENAIQSTEVQCASGEDFNKLKNEKQMAYYWEKRNLISLDCDDWEQKRTTGAAQINLIHEYFRVIKLEVDKTYKYSTVAFKEISNFEQTPLSYDKAQTYQELVDLYNSAQRIDQMNTLGRNSEFACKFIDADNKFYIGNYSFKRVAQGTYQNPVAYKVYETFVINNNFELISYYNPYRSESYQAKNKFVFRQLPNGILIGIKINKTKKYWMVGEMVETIEYAINCERKEFTL